jgi:hypothetical protein
MKALMQSSEPYRQSELPALTSTAAGAFSVGAARHSRLDRAK